MRALQLPVAALGICLLLAGCGRKNVNPDIFFEAMKPALGEYANCGKAWATKLRDGKETPDNIAVTASVQCHSYYKKLQEAGTLEVLRQRGEGPANMKYADQFGKAFAAIAEGSMRQHIISYVIVHRTKKSGGSDAMPDPTFNKPGNL